MNNLAKKMVVFERKKGERNTWQAISFGFTLTLIIFFGLAYQITGITLLGYLAVGLLFAGYALTMYAIPRKFSDYYDMVSEEICDKPFDELEDEEYEFFWKFTNNYPKKLERKRV